MRWQDIYEKFKDDLNITFLHLWQPILEVDSLACYPDSVVVVDDCAGEFKDKDWLRRFYTADSHHLRITIIR